MAKNNPIKKSSGGKTKASRNGVIGIGILVPLVLVLAVIPLIVRMNLVPLPATVQQFWATNYATDFFSYYKSKLLILTAIYMLIAFAYYKANEVSDSDFFSKSFYVYFITAAVFALCSVLATLFSTYKTIAVWGAPERCEGLVMLLTYLLILLYAIWAYLHKPEAKFVVLPLGILVIATTFLGIFQFWGHDLFTTAAGQSLIIPSVYRSQGKLELLFERGKIYGTMYHYNYMGSFTAMMIPLFLVLTLFLKKNAHKVFCGIITLCSLFLLLGSTSRAGIIGVAFAAICFLVFFAQKLVQHYKISLASIATLVVFVFAVNIITGGLALARVPSLIRDAGALFAKSDVDYHTQIPLQHIDLQKNSAALQYSDGTLMISKNVNNQPVIQAPNGEFFTAPGENASFEIGNHKFDLQYLDINGMRTPFLAIYIGKNVDMILGLFDDEFSFVDSRVHRVKYVDAPAIGFHGKERLGSARGYIWSRSLPLVVNSPIFGHGPDTFFAEFPQGDFLGKYYAYGTSQMIVDKAHNLYLQIAIGEGLPALIAFLVMVFAYIGSSFRLYAFRKDYSESQAFGAAITLAIVGYLGAGFFNDSIVSVAPIFWVLLGVGIAVNYLNSKQSSIDTTEQN